MNKYDMQKILLGSMLTTVMLVYSVPGFSALYGDSYWQVEKGDSVYSIARKVFPDDVNKQRQFRKQLLTDNAEVFNGNANQLSVGDRLILPAFAVKVAPLKQAAPVAERPIADRAPVEPVVEKVVLEEKPVTHDPEDIIGHVVISVGGMQASNRGVFRKLLRHSEVLRGDTLSTSARSYTQVRMKDGALISLRPNTKLKITDYRFNGKQDGSERSVMELVSGGFRTITGYIGHLNKQNYRVKTAVATIGIRGTHYGLMICADGSCKGESVALEDGVYGGVVDGSIVVENESGISTFNNDQYFYVASAAQSPVEQLVPPPVFHGKNEKLAAQRDTDGRNADAGGKVEAATGKLKDSAKQFTEGRVSGSKIRGDRLGTLLQSYIDDRRPPVVFRDQVTDVIKDKPSVDFAPNGSAVLLAFSGEDSMTGNLDTIAAPVLVIDANNNAIVLGRKVETDGTVINNLPIAIHEEGDGGVHNLVLPSGASGISNTGGNGIGVNWGRWSDNYVFTENDVPLQSAGDVHFIYSDKLTRPTEMAELVKPVALGGLTASETYTYAGGTTPTNALGQVVTLQNIQVVSDFQQQTIDYDVQVQDGTTGFTMGASGVSFSNMSEFSLNQINCTTTCSGNASAAFVGSRAEGVMTTYSIRELGTGLKGANGAALLVRDIAAAGTTGAAQ